MGERGLHDEGLGLHHSDRAVQEWGALRQHLGHG